MENKSTSLIKEQKKIIIGFRRYLKRKKFKLNKKLFYNLDAKHIYLDNAASTPILNYVKEEVDAFLKTYGSIHRGAGKFSKISTAKYEEARKVIEKFINAKDGRDVVIFTGNTTEAINKMAQLYSFQTNDVVLTSDIEHSSNLLPWKKFAKVETFETDKYYRITSSAVEKKIQENNNIKIVAISGASNLTGLIAPIKEIYEVCKKYNVYLFIDASQLASHYPMSLDDCDFVAFSGHKMYAPMGGGVLAGRKEILDNTGTTSTGGGNVCYVHKDLGVIYKQAPWKHEPGTPSGVGAISIASAAKVLMNIGWDEIIKHNNEISKWIIETFKELKNVKLIFPNEELVNQGIVHTPIAVFDVNGRNNSDVAEMLSLNNISVRAGTFCLYNLIERIKDINKEEKDNIYCKINETNECKLPLNYSLIRASGGLMTQKKDFKKLVEILKENIYQFEYEEKNTINSSIENKEKFDSYKFLKRLPITLNNYYGDPVLQWENTINKLKRLAEDKHEGPVSIITKGYIDFEKAKQLKEITKGLKFIVFISISELPKSIEPLPQKHRYESINNLIKNDIKVIGYVRPFIPGYNDTKEKIDKIFKSISEAGCNVIVVSGFRGDDNVVLKTDVKEKEKWVVRVKQMPKNIASDIEELAKKYNISVYNRTSCGVTNILKESKTYNPYYNSAITAGCETCSIKDTCKHEEPFEGSLEFIKMLGYDIEYVKEGNDICKVSAENRLSCPSCCTTCYILKVPHILVKNEGINLGDLAFIRFITGVLACKKNVVDDGLSTVGEVNFPEIKSPKKIHCLNTWYEWATQIKNCYGCKYCIIPIYNLCNDEYGCSPKELSEYINKELHEKRTNYEKIGFGCPVGCKYCMVTHIDSRREKWKKKHRFGMNKTVLFINKLENEKPLKEMNIDLDILKGEYVGFEGITDAFNPIFNDDLMYMLNLSKTSDMKKLVLVTKWPVSDEQLKMLKDNKKVLLVVTVTGLDMLENITTEKRINVIKRAKEMGIDVLPIIHPYIHELSDISFLKQLAEIGIKEISLKGLRYNEKWMGYWGRKYLNKEIYDIYLNNQEQEILLGEDYVIQQAKKYCINIIPFRQYVHRDNGVKGISREEAKKNVDKIFKQVVISSSDNNDAVYNEAINRRL